MADKNGKILDLDELFGQTRPIAVNWEGRRYELRRPDSLTPQEYVRWNKLNGKMTAMQSVGDELTDKQAVEMDEVISNCVRMLSSDLGEQKLSFPMKVRILQFYTEALKEEKEPAGTPQDP